MAIAGQDRFEVARPTGVCAATGQAIRPGDEYIAALVERAGEDGLARLDFSRRAWTEGARPGAGARVFGYWRARMDAGETRARRFIDDDALVELFEQLADDPDPGQLAFRYLVALVLVRKRLLRYESSREDPTGRVMLVRWARPAGAADAAPLEIPEPALDRERLAQALDRLGQVLGPGSGAPSAQG